MIILRILKTILIMKIMIVVIIMIIIQTILITIMISPPGLPRGQRHSSPPPAALHTRAPRVLGHSSAHAYSLVSLKVISVLVLLLLVFATITIILITITITIAITTLALFRILLLIRGYMATAAHMRASYGQFSN